MKKQFTSVLLILVSLSTYAGGYSNWAVPTTVELVYGGVLIHGAFGDPNNCGKADYMFVSETDSQYDSVVSMALSALMAKREMNLYSSSCTTVGFHWSGNIINQSQNGQPVYIR